MLASRQTRRIAVLSLTGLALVGLAACSGGDDETPDGAAATSPAASATATASASPTEASPSASAGGGSTASDVSEIENAEDLAHVMTTAMRAAGSVKLKLTAASASGTGGTLTGVGSMVLGDDPAMQITATTGGQTVKLRLVDGAVYLSPGQQLMGKSWIKLDPQGGDKLSKTFAGLVGSLASAADVSESTTGFEQATSFKRLGAKELGGEQTQGFEVVLEEEALRAVVAQHQRTAGPELDGAEATFTIYLNDKGEPRQVTTESTYKSGTSKQVVDYSDWGSKVTVAPPPAAQVVDSSQLG